MGDKKRIPRWLIAVSAVVLVAVIAGVVIGVVALVSNNNLGTAWPTMQAYYTDLQSGDYVGAFALLSAIDHEKTPSPSALQQQCAGITFNPSNTSLVKEDNDGQYSTLTVRNNTTGKVFDVPCYNEDGSWHLSLSEATEVP